MEHIYFDNAGTTPMHPEVIATMTKAMTENFGNASAVNFYGRQARGLLDQSRHTIAQSINAQKDTEIVFTSGGTESDNTAITQVAHARKAAGRHIITSQIEHEAVLKPLEALEEEGFEVTYLPVDENGVISLEQLKQALRPDTILVTIMMGNNEVGSQQSIQAIGEIVAESNALFHTDAVQAYGVSEIDVQAMHIDLLSTSAHKIQGPKFLGFLYRRDGINFKPLLKGGDQELKRRAGTENVPAIVAFAKAVEIAQTEKQAHIAHYRNLKQTLVDGLQTAGVDFEINGHYQNGELPQIISLWFKDCPSDSLLTNLDLGGVIAAAGSACTAGSLEPSHVLAAMYGKNSPRVGETLRFSFGAQNTVAEVEQAVAALVKVTTRLKQRKERR
ncbi:cysteine desulfurase family protein [Ligilactobacillus equi]|uniref:Cysteine desulfurase selenocysteine lyase n=1 Tax=Ligilactobacillus equi DSM 15833 = JCM 10991 TaxID=1423740 RepID=A0A0R1TVS2_9LACO|nr:cysteine desulfurase family protein [Ligilactobacillus equi]KRL85261.1 cysteine desulfurase selenocysteine lyase [Ligilactobacillus equi DSM 15833 = JCM 10991]